MKGDDHKRAELLMAAARVEDVHDSDRAWLNSHLEECTSCSARAESIERALAAFRSMPAQLNPAVVEATRLRVRARALELRDHRAHMRGLWMACAFSWIVGVLSAPVLWYAFKWVGERYQVPQPLWVAALSIYWVIPAAAGAAALAWRRSRSSQTEDFAGNGWQ